MHLSKHRLATLIGCGAFVIWTVEALMVAELTTIPLFEALTIIFVVSFGLTAMRLTVKKRWYRVKNQPLGMWALGLLGICGSDFTYMLAFRYAPPAHVDLIDYFWPVSVVCLSGFFPGEKFSLKHMLGTGIGIFGVMILITDGQGMANIQMAYVPGYLLAFGGALVWGIHTLFSRHFKDVPTEMVGMYCGVGALITLGLHAHHEVFVWPTLSEWGCTIMLGLAGAGCAYQVWDYGAKFGDLYLLSMLAFLTPFFSMTFLVLSGYEPLSVQLYIACALVSVGLSCSQMDWRKTFNWSKSLFTL